MFSSDESSSETELQPRKVATKKRVLRIIDSSSSENDVIDFRKLPEDETEESSDPESASGCENEDQNVTDNATEKSDSDSEIIDNRDSTASKIKESSNTSGSKVDKSQTDAISATSKYKKKSPRIFNSSSSEDEADQTKSSSNDRKSSRNRSKNLSGTTKSISAQKSPNQQGISSTEKTQNTSDLNSSESIIEDSFSEKSNPKKSSLEVIEDSFDESLNVSEKLPIASSTQRVSQSFTTYRESPIQKPHQILNKFPQQVNQSFTTYRESPAQKPLQISNSSSDEDDVVVEISSGEEPTVTQPPQLKQTNLKSFLNNKQSPTKGLDNKRKVTEKEFKDQQERVQNLEQQLFQIKNASRVLNLEKLPDKGKQLTEKNQALSELVRTAKQVLSNMVVDEATKSANAVQIAWDEIEAGMDAVGPRTLGKKGLARFDAEKQMTIETLDALHNSLKTCPTENDLIETPNSVKVDLMRHQKRALAWLLWREQQKPSGGILADDMGLGKTLTMLSLVVKVNDLEASVEREMYRDKYPGGTLVVCPASLLNQWTGEVESKLKRGILSVELYHGPKRETKPKRLAKHDLVVTTYSIVQNEVDRQGAVFKVRWRRIILDEAHQIRNHKSLTSTAVCQLSGKSRWALTGTPVQNKELDMYAILKFLRCSPFDDFQVWKHWVGDKSTGGQERLHAVISSLMLRRTKAELVNSGVLNSLPERQWELIKITIDQDEMQVYQKILIFSRTLFAQFLHQRAEKRQDEFNMNSPQVDPNGEYFKMRNRLLKLNNVKEVKQHEILVLLLRLRQICCHPSLITKMLQGDEDLGDADDQEGSAEMNLLEQLNNLTLAEEKENVADGASNDAVGLKEASKGYLNPSHPIFAEDRQSSKIKTLIKVIKEKVPAGDKAIVVSQWASFLRLIGRHLKNEGIKFEQLDGSIPVIKRMPIVNNFNNPKHSTRVLLLSLTAGGVGLNLIGANHLFLLDLHWNPQLENQAQDRIYRVGQTKPIFVYKLMAVDTIEERVKSLQDRKLEIADSMLTGSKHVINSKLTLQDLKMLFEFK